MKVLVTGATGFIGKHLINELLEKNYQLKIITRQKNIDIKNVETINGDLQNIDSFKNAFKDIDAVFHNGAYAMDYGDKSIIFNTNVQGTKKIAELCLKNNVQNLIYTSSAGVYGFPNSEIEIIETSDKNPLNNYHKSKLESERILQNFKELKISIIRPPLVIGPGGMATKVIMDRVLNDKMFLIGKGENIIPLVHPKDVALCLRLAFEKDKKGTIFNVVSFHCQIKELFKELLKQLNIDKPIKHVPYSIAYLTSFFFEIVSNEPSITRFRVKSLGTTRKISYKKAEQNLGYKPKYNLQTTINDIVQWYNAKNNFIKK
jgi:nucleoside-diphosphate-sugar epimerase